MKKKVESQGLNQLCPQEKKRGREWGIFSLSPEKEEKKRGRERDVSDELDVKLGALEAGFNNYLALDPDARPGFDKLAGKLIQLHFSGIDLAVYFLVHPQRVEILEHFEAQPDAVISGAPFSMLALATGRKTIFESDVTISGDTETAQQFSRALERIDIDWEEHLSRLTGDTVAHHVGRSVRGLRAWTERTRSTLHQNTADYLRDETSHLPHDWELQEFTDQVDDLRDRVERLAVKIESKLSAAGNVTKHG